MALILVAGEDSFCSSTIRSSVKKIDCSKDLDRVTPAAIRIQYIDIRLCLVIGIPEVPQTTATQRFNFVLDQLTSLINSKVLF